MHVCYRVQQDPVGKDKIPFIFLELMTVEELSLTFCINRLFYLYRYGRGAYPTPFYPQVPHSLV
jgi:hypothetical protein